MYNGWRLTVNLSKRAVLSIYVCKYLCSHISFNLNVLYFPDSPIPL